MIDNNLTLIIYMLVVLGVVLAIFATIVIVLIVKIQKNKFIKTKNNNII